MEPPSTLDNKSHNLQDHHKIGDSDLIVCDLGDEEVHFSRDTSDYYYQVAGINNNDTDIDGNNNSTSQQTRYSNTTIHSLDTNNLDFGENSNPGHENDQSGSFHDLTTSDQIKSSQLLHIIGNKLGCWSNYSNAPTRLVGQYLLGITIQSWSEFFNTSRMMKAPRTKHELTRQLVTNLTYFQGNYLCVSLILVIYCVLTSTLLLIAITAYLLALYLVTVRSALGKQTEIFGYRLNLQQQYSFITMLSLPPLWIAGAPSAVFWVIGASFFVVGAHASMYTSDLILNEQLALSNVSVHRNEVRFNRIIEPHHHTGYTELGRPRAASKSSIQYYNHYPQVSGKQGYISLSQLPSPNKVATATGSSSNNLSGSATGGSYVSSTITQWITFGTTKDSEQPATSSSSARKPGGNYSKIPDVKIISRDYAGLDGVYEV